MSAVNGLYTNFYIFSSDLLKAVGGGLFLRSVPGFEDVPAVMFQRTKRKSWFSRLKFNDN